ncbi:MAG: zinc ribbon domain-containing protein [Bryobacteraceae bacterium]
MFEVIQKFSDEPLTAHSVCGGKVERLLSPPALQFKGTGWYVTDYARKNGASPANGHGSESKNGSESKAENKAKAEAPSKNETGAAKK